ncbi:MAG: hypothetical protein ACM3ML_12965 [Micromonosporaceae bacterium]
MSEEIRRVAEYESDPEVREAWQRFCDDPDVRGVSATWFSHGGWSGWQVVVAVAEFLREDPLEGELRERMAAALGGVDGAREVAEDDREVWLVTGGPSGEALVRAAAGVVDGLADRARAYLDAVAGDG